MSRRVTELADEKAFRAFAWELYSEVESGRTGLQELYVKKMLWDVNQIYNDRVEEEEEWPTDFPDVNEKYANFAVALVLKGLRDGRWKIQGENIIENNHEVNADSMFSGDFIKCYDYKNAEHIELISAPLEHITEDNALAVFALIDFIISMNITSIEELRSYQRYDPAKYDLEEIKRIVTQYIKGDIYALHDPFLDESETLELIKEGWNEAASHMDHAVSLRDVMNAVTEINFWMCEMPLFPYSEYMVLTGKQSDKTFSQEQPAPAVPDESEQMDEAKQMDDPTFTEEGREIFRKAIAGDLYSLETLGQMYIAGENVEADQSKAVYWVRKAAMKGIASAQTNYGVFLQKGYGGLKVDNEEAVEWFLRAAEQGEEVAEYNLGMAYVAGRGVTRNMNTAMEWFRKSASKGYSPAKFIMENKVVFNV